MSEAIKHECGIAFIRLLKPLQYYLAKYGTAFYALNKMYLLMEKQHNRGQDGAGIANIKFDMKPGIAYINRQRSAEQSAIKDIFDPIYEKLKPIQEKTPERLMDVEWLKENIEFTGEVFMGHLRYGTFGKYSIENIHPFIRKNNWMSKNLVLSGNFNLTNVDELFQKLLDIGQHPVETSDSITILEKIGYFLDEENEELYWKYKKEGYSKKDISPKIAENLDVQKILQNACKYWDGGYVISGIFGHGDAFILRDPAGIRPAYYYKDDEIIIAASERPAIQTAFNIPFEKIQEIKPGYALIVKKNGLSEEKECKTPLPKRSCSFERIYFSRGTDAEIYQERKKLGQLLVPSILKAIDYEIEDTVFSYIPNTAAVAYYGVTEALNSYCNTIKRDRLLLAKDSLDAEKIDKILSFKPRIDKIAVKDAKLRTFITEDNSRNEMVTHIYDTTYGIIRKGIDNLVVIDDSIVRGTTLKQSIIRLFERLEPKRIIIVSSAPQIRYPDCYGIDMAKLSDFIAFKATMALHEEILSREQIITKVYNKCKAQELLPKEQMQNFVKEIYKPFTPSQISDKIAKMLKPKDSKAEIIIVYQSIEALHSAIPNHLGDWYFTGDYPTPGGNKIVNTSFINHMEGRGKDRPYQLT